PTSVRNDAPIRIGNWTPENYEQKYSGVVTLATALAHSLNTIAAQLVMEVGPANVIKLAHRVGIDSELQDNASIALGTSEVSLLELTSSYAAFMNGGYKATPHVITKVTSASGKVLYDENFADPPRVLSPAVVTNMNYMMENVMAIGTGKSAKIPGWQAAGKSGTTQSFRDALFVGFTSDLTTGVWFGNDDGKSMKKVTGGGLPAKTWKDFMIAAHKGLTPAPLFGNGQMVDNDMPVAQAGGNADPSTISGIISGVLGGNNNAAGTAPTATNPAIAVNPAAGVAPGANAHAANPPTATLAPRQIPAQQPAVAVNDVPEDMPPVGPGPDNNPYAAHSPTPPADIGESPTSSRPRRTTLLDYLMGR
ncbi:MAG: penicillin-binding transpeptidase domain-containing protein, partial [Rhizobium sp.]